MRFITFDKNGVDQVGVRVGSDLVDLSLADPKLPRTLLALIQNDLLKQAGEAAMKAPASAHRSLEGLKYLPVIPRPPKFFGLGTNYASHVTERPETPGFFISSHYRLTGHNQPLHIPKKSKTLDHEVELAFVFKKPAWHVPAKNALDYVAGYTVFNDGSVRGYGTAITLAIHKSSDNTGPLGPEFVTPDELPPGCDGLTIQLRRNGKVVQKDNTKNMFWKIHEAIEMASSYMSFETGDVMTTGTCGGTVADTNRGKDMRDESLPFLKPGEVIESEVEGVGILRNPIEMEPDSKTVKI